MTLPTTTLVIWALPLPLLDELIEVELFNELNCPEERGEQYVVGHLLHVNDVITQYSSSAHIGHAGVVGQITQPSEDVVVVELLMSSFWGWFSCVIYLWYSRYLSRCCFFIYVIRSSQMTSTCSRKMKLNCSDLINLAIFSWCKFLHFAFLRFSVKVRQFSCNNWLGLAQQYFAFQKIDSTEIWVEK